MKKFFILVSVISILAIAKFVVASVEYSVGGGVQRVQITDGQKGNAFAMLCDSTTARSLYANAYDNAFSSNAYNPLSHRSTFIFNDLPQNILIATFSTFGYSDPYIIVSTGPSSLTIRGHYNLWLRFLPGASSGTVRGMIEEE